ncbi:hypothetical protein E3P99_00416 [Wallemia hederae]|uniref:F-box domain-containing protein n=1 Tax=Wallemia hederae TaxID=1540922 RepID=A0A4T0FVZ7_9BASI|nr:hypothetical protein E3P99_00416 [Wallemia hederae]
MLNLPFELVDEIISYLSFEDRQNLTLVKNLSAASSWRALQTMSVTDFDKNGLSVVTSPRVADNVRNLTVNCEFSIKLPHLCSTMRHLQTLQLDLRFISHQMELFSKGGSIKAFGGLSLTTFLPTSNTITGLTLRLHSTNDIHCNRIVLDELILRYPCLETLAIIFEKQSGLVADDIEPVMTRLAELPLSVVVVKWQQGCSYDRLRVLSARKTKTASSASASASASALRRVVGRLERVAIASSLFHFEQIAGKYGY